jgi:hypothetical protein
MRTEEFTEVHDRLVAERTPVLTQRRTSRRLLVSIGHPEGPIDAESGLPAAAAGGDTVPSHPLGPPTLNNNEITVDLMLNQPTRVTRMIMDMSLQRFITDRVFASAGSVSGGAVIYDEATANELYAVRDVQRVEPGDEFPVIETERPVPKVATVSKWGGKVFITDEARDRNNSALFTRKVRQLTNTIVLKNNQRAMKVLTDSVSASGQTFAGRDWDAVVTGGSSQSAANLWPARDFAMAAQLSELGVNYTLLLLNPAQYTQLIIIYGAQGLRDLLAAMGLSIYVSNRVPAGKGYFVEEGAVGEARLEKPLTTESWREEKTQRNWIQTDVRPVEYVTNPYAILEVTGL